MLRLFAYAGALQILVLALALATRAAALIALALLLGLAIVAAFAFLQLSRPRKRGTIRLTALGGPVSLGHDEHGTPHVTAENWHDLFLAQGYLAARERLWQMEVARRTAAGRLAEIRGEALLERDRLMRTLGLQRLAERALADCPADVRACLEAYADGVNAFIAEGHLPPEFALARIVPDPWRAVDSLAVAKLLAFELTLPLADELVRLQVAQVAGPAAAAALFAGADRGAGQDAGVGAGIGAADASGLPELADLCELASHAPQTIAGGLAWAVSGERTASGFPIAGCALETAPRAPSPLHPLVLSGPEGARLEGVALAGLPGLLAGRSRHFAWGFAPAGSGAAVLALEPADPQGVAGGTPPTAVQTSGSSMVPTAAQVSTASPVHGSVAQSAPAVCAGAAEPSTAETSAGTPEPQRLEMFIRVRGQGLPVPHTIEFGAAGPVLAAGPSGRLVLQSPVLQPAAEAAALLGINRARSYAEFRAALAGWTAPGLAAVYAGIDGTIARIETGPELREVVNPPDGVVVAGQPAGVADRARGWLEARSDWDAERLAPLSVDTVSVQAATLLQPMLQALQEGLRQGVYAESLSQLEKQALLLLSDWDRDEPVGSGAACLWERWYFALLEDVFRPRMGLTLFNQFAATRTGLEAAERLLLRTLSGEENPWLSLEGELGLPRLALQAFRRTVAYLAARQGRRPESWSWGREHQVRFRHSLGQAVPALRHLADLGPFPLSGGPSSINRSGPAPADPGVVRTATTYRRIDDLSGLGASAAILAPGAAGHPLDPSFADRIVPWLRGELTRAQAGSGSAEFRMLPPPA
ncbi:penicillin acylase family protein [Symbiobacterium terraclitae]|uniref:penicillin acylase family protein n=1 Tax=Symbiobacterium terraclitae TaxID=557451 RepID=UPI0035B50117